jgi:hypothetical protein
MTTESLYTFIQELDHQLEQLDSKEFQSKFEPLVKLRNHLILKYRPCPELNWEIKNKRVLKLIKKANWELQWRHCS